MEILTAVQGSTESSAIKETATTIPDIVVGMHIREQTDLRQVSGGSGAKMTSRTMEAVIKRETAKTAEHEDTTTAPVNRTEEHHSGDWEARLVSTDRRDEGTAQGMSTIGVTLANREEGGTRMTEWAEGRDLVCGAPIMLLRLNGKTPP